MPRRKPRCIIIAGPNGAGKTTFAREFLPKDAGVLHFVNADLIAAGLSPLDPPAAQVAAARIFLEELDRLAAARVDFAFETTLSGRTYLERVQRWRGQGYRVEVVFLKLSSVDLALKRVALRVKQGGHHVPEAVCADASRVVGLTLRRSTYPRWMLGRYMTTPETSLG